MDIAITLVLVAFFLAMNAFFVIAEFALVRVRPSQIEIALEEGKKGAKNAKLVSSNINAYLSACQLGITLASLALGWLGEPAFAQLIRPLCQLIGLPEAVIEVLAVGLGFFIMTTLHVVVGELIPKSFAIFSTEKFALFTATPLLWFYRVTFPIMILFNGITNGTMKLFGHGNASEHEVYTGEEIQLLIDESTESGLIAPEQNEFVDNIFDLGDKTAEDIMTPRTDVVCLDLEDSIEENLALVRQYKFSRYPVCEGNKDRIVGFVHVKDLYLGCTGNVSGLGAQSASRGGVAAAGAAAVSEAAASLLTELPVRPIEAVPESITVARLLQTLRTKHAKIAVVIDEHGGTAGIVTYDDVIEQFVGRMDDEYAHEYGDDIVEVKENTYLLEGLLPIDDLVELMGFRPKEADECATAAGLLLCLFDRIPKVGDAIVCKNAAYAAPDEDEAVAEAREGERPVAEVTFTVDAMDAHRIDRITMKISRG